MKTVALIFPGQGSQFIGMGEAMANHYPVAQTVFEEVDDALHEPLSALIFSGDEAELTLTQNAQPALMAVSMAIFHVLRQEFDIDPADFGGAAGHSLGEYSALCALQSLSLAQTARLLRLRGQAMQAAVPLGTGAMASLIGSKVDIAFAEAAASEGNQIAPCVVANDNNVGNIVISGKKEGVDAAIAWANSQGARAIMLNVSAPFHSPLMEPAASAMQEALASSEIAAPQTNLFANVTASPTRDASAIAPLLVAQVTGRVRWRESILAMVDHGITHFVEIGAGKTLSQMIKRIAPGAKSLVLSEPADLEKFAALQGELRG